MMPPVNRLPPTLKHVASLGLTLLVFWWLLSGYTKPLLLGLGLVSIVLVLVLALRMEVVDHDSHPVGLSLPLLRYWPWLLKEICKANWQVARLVLQRDPQLSPTRVQVPTTKHSDVGRVTFANSITLTPGTVSLAVEEGAIDAVALTRDGAKDLLSGEMERRVPDWRVTE